MERYIICHSIQFIEALTVYDYAYVNDPFVATLFNNREDAVRYKDRIDNNDPRIKDWEVKKVTLVIEESKGDEE